MHKRVDQPFFGRRKLWAQSASVQLRFDPFKTGREMLARSSRDSQRVVVKLIEILVRSISSNRLADCKQVSGKLPQFVVVTVRKDLANSQQPELATLVDRFQLT